MIQALARHQAEQERHVIGKVTRGQKVGGLLRYLYGPGRFNEHKDPHLVAAWDGDLELLEPALTGDAGHGRFDVRALAAVLSAPLEALGDAAPSSPVWQASLRVAPGDRALRDEEWADIARDAMARVGLAKPEDHGGVRWLAVRHADDHVHLVATLARQDGRPLRLFRDFIRLREAAQAAESKYRLQSTAPADKTAAYGPSRAETEKAARAGAGESVRETLRRHVRVAAAGAMTEPDFWRRLAAEGVSVKQRFSERSPGKVTGYAVGLGGGDASAPRAGTTRGGELVMFAGGKLAPDLSLPKLRARWNPADTPLGPRHPLTGLAREQVWAASTTAAAAAAEHVCHYTAAGTLEQAADAAWATSDLLSSAAEVIGDGHDGPMRRAADDYGRAARSAYRRVPQRSATGSELRAAAVMLAMLGTSSVREAAQVTALLLQLNRLIEAVADLRDAQGHAAQAAAALRVAHSIAQEQGGCQFLADMVRAQRMASQATHAQQIDPLADGYAAAQQPKPPAAGRAWNQ